MIAATALEPISSASTSMADYRSRMPMAERSVLPDATPAAASSADTGSQLAQDRGSNKPPAQNAIPAPVPGSMFAAAVIAGQLSPRPETMKEVLMRIGSAPIPPESELRLRELIV